MVARTHATRWGTRIAAVEHVLMAGVMGLMAAAAVSGAPALVLVVVFATFLVVRLQDLVREPAATAKAATMEVAMLWMLASTVATGPMDASMEDVFVDAAWARAVSWVIVVALVLAAARCLRGLHTNGLRSSPGLVVDAGMAVLMALLVAVMG
ncbi:MAG: hypothetical protein JWO46_1578 [Nocardioidaceae bacterium]|nr:hypothetical protein [Nocardioidaceae bacterium]